MFANVYIQVTTRRRLEREPSHVRHSAVCRRSRQSVQEVLQVGGVGEVSAGRFESHQRQRVQEQVQTTAVSIGNIEVNDGDYDL